MVAKVGVTRAGLVLLALLALLLAPGTRGQQDTNNQMSDLKAVHARFTGRKGTFAAWKPWSGSASGFALQYRIVVRRPKMAASLIAAPFGSRAFETLPPGRNTY